MIRSNQYIIITDTIFDKTYFFTCSHSTCKAANPLQATAFWKSMRSDVLYLAT